MRCCRSLGSFALLIFLATPTLAATTTLFGPGDFLGPATVIDFDGHAHGTAANTLYSAQGVEFSYDAGGSTVPIFDWAALSRVTTSPPNVISTIDGLNGSTFSDFLDLSFSGGPTEVGMYFGNDQGLAAQSFLVRLEVFDSVGASLGFTTVATNQNVDVDQFIGLRSDDPIKLARIDYLAATGNLSVTIDDLHFTPVPEPGTGALLALGLIALARRRSSSTGE